MYVYTYIHTYVVMYTFIYLCIFKAYFAYKFNGKNNTLNLWEIKYKIHAVKRRRFYTKYYILSVCVIECIVVVFCIVVVAKEK